MRSRHPVDLPSGGTSINSSVHRCGAGLAGFPAYVCVAGAGGVAVAGRPAGLFQASDSTGSSRQSGAGRLEQPNRDRYVFDRSRSRGRVQSLQGQSFPFSIEGFPESGDGNRVCQVSGSRPRQLMLGDTALQSVRDRLREEGCPKCGERSAEIQVIGFAEISLDCGHVLDGGIDDVELLSDDAV